MKNLAWIFLLIADQATCLKTPQTDTQTPGATQSRVRITRAALRKSHGVDLRGEPKLGHKQKCPPRDVMDPCVCKEKLPGLDITCNKIKSEASLAEMTNRMRRYNRENHLKGDYHIEYFKIRDSSLARMGEHIFMNLKIVHLMIYNSQLSSLKDSALPGLASTLKHLVLSNNNLISIPSKAIVQLRELEHLNLNENSITSIPERAFHGCHKMTRITLYHNQIHSIHRDAFKGLEKDLQRLNLYHNRLTEVPTESLVYLKNLKHLDLSENQIKSIPKDAFKGLESLDFLALNHNLLTELGPAQFLGLYGLSSLEMDHNNIANIHSQAFEGLEDVLLSLSVTHNKLQYFPSSSLRPLHHLQTLHLDSNAITRIDEEAFQGWGEHIKNLWLQNNHIETIEDDAFTDLHSLQWLKLWNNNLETLHYELMEPVLDTMEHLDIHSNPLICDCEMRWYKRWYNDGWQDIDEEHIRNTTCIDPTDRMEHSIQTVDLNHMYCPRTTPLSSLCPCLLNARDQALLLLLFLTTCSL